MNNRQHRLACILLCDEQAGYGVGPGCTGTVCGTAPGTIVVPGTTAGAPTGPGTMGPGTNPGAGTTPPLHGLQQFGWQPQLAAPQQLAGPQGLQQASLPHGSQQWE